MTPKNQIHMPVIRAIIKVCHAQEIKLEANNSCPADSNSPGFYTKFLEMAQLLTYLLIPKWQIFANLRCTVAHVDIWCIYVYISPS